MGKSVIVEFWSTCILKSELQSIRSVRIAFGIAGCGYFIAEGADASAARYAFEVSCRNNELLSGHTKNATEIYVRGNAVNHMFCVRIRSRLLLFSTLLCESQSYGRRKTWFVNNILRWVLLKASAQGTGTGTCRKSPQ